MQELWANLPATSLFSELRVRMSHLFDALCWAATILTAPLVEGIDVSTPRTQSGALMVVPACVIAEVVAVNHLRDTKSVMRARLKRCHGLIRSAEYGSASELFLKVCFMSFSCYLKCIAFYVRVEHRDCLPRYYQYHMSSHKLCARRKNVCVFPKR